MNRKKDKSQLTEVELELMNIVWNLGRGSVADVIEGVAKTKKRQMAYTSAATILGILEDKKFLKSEKEGKTKFFTPLVSRSEYESRSLSKMIKKVFNNTPVAMVARLVEDENVSPEQLQAMKKLLEEKLKNE